MKNRAEVIGMGLCAFLFFAAPAWAAPDAWLTTKAKMALLTTENVGSMDINVDTIDGKVTLHGKVASEQERNTAEQAVRKVEGVRDVRNLLVVTKDAEEKKVEMSDDQVKSRVETVLDRDQALEDSDIKVQSVNDGVVLLSGKAKTLSDHYRALDDARSVDGVRNVASEIESPDGLADAEIWREGKVEEVKGESKSAASDMWITTASKVRLIANSETPALDINVDTRDGVVTLFGIVPSEASKNAAEATVRKTEGVKQVENELQVVASDMQEKVEVQDNDIEKSVEKQIANVQDLKDETIDTEVKNGVVRLTGKVDSQSDRLKALQTARTAKGVRAVVDDLTVTN